MPLYLVRHGKTSWNAIGRAQGHTDIPLDETGEAQAERLRIAFLEIPVDLILSSDLQRAQATAASISAATGARIELRPALRERAFGDWEGSEFSMVNLRLDEEASRTGRSVLTVRPPNGESIEDVWNRLGPIIDEIDRLSDQNVVISTHGAACSTLLARLIRGTLETSRAFRFHNTSITELHRRPEGNWMITRLNDVRHLADLHIPLAAHGKTG